MGLPIETVPPGHVTTPYGIEKCCLLLSVGLRRYSQNEDGECSGRDNTHFNMSELAIGFVPTSALGRGYEKTVWRNKLKLLRQEMITKYEFQHYTIKSRHAEPTNVE